jgi:hypothetical protein
MEKKQVWAKLISNNSQLKSRDESNDLSALFAWLISHQPAVLFSQNKPAMSNQPAVPFSQTKSAPAISHQPNEQAVNFTMIRNVIYNDELIKLNEF